MSDETPLILKPATGRLVRDPQTMAPLSEDGERKSRSIYWERRLRDGDVVEVSPEDLPEGA